MQTLKSRLGHLYGVYCVNKLMRALLYNIWIWFE